MRVKRGVAASAKHKKMLTRAKEKVYLLGDKTSINKTILNNNTIERKTNLLNLISEYYN